MNAPVVELLGVCKSYGEVKALNNLNLRLEPGQVLGLLGHNGAGKTTAMKLILGIHQPSAGTIRVFGHMPGDRQADRLRSKLGYLPESVTFYDQLSGREVLGFLGRLKKVKTTQIDELLERAGLQAVADRRVKTYSRGMRQRLGLAQALLGKPQLLLLDEPTASLDPAATRDFYHMLDELRGRGVSIMLSSHLLAGVERHIDRAAILGQGRLLATGTLQELRERAGLPLLIRVQGRFNGERWQPRLGDERIQTHRVNGDQLELLAPVGAKMDMLRQLLDDPNIQDIEMEPPSLETLYAHFGNRESQPGERQ